MAVVVPTLTRRFVKTDGDGDGRVERGERTRHRQTRQAIARGLDSSAKPLSLRTDDEDHRTCQVDLLDGIRSAGIEANDAKPGLLQRGERAGKGRHATEDRVLDRARRRSKRRSRERRRTMFGPKNGGRAARHARAQNRAEVLRILQLVERDDERARTELEPIERHESQRRGEGDRALVTRPSCEAIEIPLGGIFHRRSLIPRIARQRAKLWRAVALTDEDALEL